MKQKIMEWPLRADVEWWTKVPQYATSKATIYDAKKLSYLYTSKHQGKHDNNQIIRFMSERFFLHYVQ